MIVANQTSPSQRLKAKLDIAFPAMMAEAQKIWQSSNLDTLYPFYLETMHMVVRSAVPLMDAALVEAERLAPNDPVAAGLHSFLEHHREEERGHDDWLLEDYRVTGGDPEQPINTIPPAEVAQLVGAQYYWLYHYHPVALLGHMTAIEGYHPPKGFADKLSTLSTYPPNAFRAIRRHETLDVYHKQELFDLVDNLPLDHKHEKMISISGLHTMRAGVELMGIILTRHDRNQTTPLSRDQAAE